VHKLELRADSKGSRQRVGELNLKFSGTELDLAALTTATANGQSFIYESLPAAFKIFIIFLVVIKCLNLVKMCNFCE